MKQHARAIACFMFVLCVSSSMGATIASIWQQCGGTSCPSGVCQDAEWKDTKCAAGLKCFRQSEYYYQCRATAQLYEQCGGTSCQFKGVCADSNWAACTNDHKCVRKSEFYWQCLPANLAQVQSTTTKASVQSTAAAAPSSAKNMRLSQAQLAHVPIPRHSVVHVSSKKPAAEEAVASIASVAAPTRIRPVEEAQPEQIRPAAAAAAVSTAAIKPAAAAKPAAIGMPYSSEPTKPSATVAAKATPVSIASTSSSASTAAAAKPSRESKPAAVGMPDSAEPTKPAQDASVSVASAAAAKPSGESKPAGMPYSAEPTRPGSSSSSISTAALSSRAARAEPSSSAAAARGAREQRDAAELQWERPALSTASVQHEEPRPSGRRPPQMRPQT